MHPKSFLLLLLSSSLFLNSHFVFAEKNANKPLLEELRALADKSRQQRAADRWLQRSLDDLVARYDWPWQQSILFEDFSDGNFTHNPTWKVLSGQFKVIRGQGLYTKHQVQNNYSNQAPTKNQAPTNDIGGFIIGALLDQAIPTNSNNNQQTNSHRAARNEPSRIRLKANVTNAFALTMAFRQSKHQATNFHISLMQSESSQYGYRLHIDSGAKGFIELERIRRGRASIVESKPLNLSINDAHLHDLAWRQAVDGTISVLLDEKPIFSVQDRAFRDDYPWLDISVSDGDLAVRSIRIDGN